MDPGSTAACDATHPLPARTLAHAGYTGGCKLRASLCRSVADAPCRPGCLALYTISTRPDATRCAREHGAHATAHCSGGPHGDRRLATHGRAPMIRFEHVTYTYGGAAAPVLRDLNLTI